MIFQVVNSKGTHSYEPIILVVPNEEEDANFPVKLDIDCCGKGVNCYDIYLDDDTIDQIIATRLKARGVEKI
jgi:hypothetical protein